MKPDSLLHTAEIVVLGGTLAGMEFALGKARAGKHVVLIEARTYLGTEISATLRPWIPAGGEPFPELVAACIDATGLPAVQGEYPLHLNAIKKRFEDILMQAGVELLYGCNLVKRTEDGVLIGSKSGLAKIVCSQVWDARWQASQEGDSESETVALTLEFEGTAFEEFLTYVAVPNAIAVPERLGMEGDRVRLHRGYKQGDHPYLRSHVLVECEMKLAPVEKDLFAPTNRYLQAREKALAVASYLLWEHPIFRLASLGKVSEALYESGMRKITPRLLGNESGASQAFPPLETDVLVVGGGTSGALAGIAAAQQGVRSLIVEMNPGLGGTGTYGGVSMYWMGWRKGFAALSTQWTDAYHDRLRYPHMQGVLGVWNIEAKTQALLEKAQSAGVEVLIDTRVVDAILEAGRVVGVLAATPLGMVELRARVVIDATGDGDIAAFAGAAFDYGSERDGSTMWYSLPQFKGPGKVVSNFTAMLDLTDPADYTRAIVWGRRRRGSLYDYGGYLAPREARRIRGEVTQSLSDQLRKRAYPDVITIAVSNNDIKGQTSSDWLKVGLIPPNLEIEISYGMLIPRGLEGMLVVGKAISVERDALPSIRMQPDFENLGGAAGIAAALAAKSGRDVRDIDISLLQRKLIDIEVLPSGILTRQLVPRAYAPEEIQGLVDTIVQDPYPLRQYSLMEVNEVFVDTIPFVELCCAGQAAVPIIKQALEKPMSQTARRQLGRALALMGSPSAVDVLLEEIKIALSREKLPGLSGLVKHAQPEAPDQAAMPDAAYLLNALALVGDQRAIPVWKKVVDKLVDVSLDDVFATQSGVFAYVDAVCSGAERWADPRVVPLLERLAAVPALRGHHLRKRSYPTGQHADYLLERAAYLELVIARALARCGSPQGVITLTNYLSDVRKLYARHAHRELVAISGQDFGADVAAWGQWLESAGEGLPTVPWKGPLETQAAWETAILVSKEA